jgi:flagellar hook-associated protein FlgK
MQIGALQNSLAGIQRSTANIVESSEKIANSNNPNSGINIETETVNLLENETYYKANAKVLQTELDSLGTLLDIKA